MQLVISLLLVIFAPAILNALPITNLNTIRSQSPSAKFTAGAEYNLGIVDKILDEKTSKEEGFGATTRNQKVKIYVTTGADKGTNLELSRVSDAADPKQGLAPNDELILRSEKRVDKVGDKLFMIVDKLRLFNLAVVFGIFMVLVIALAGIRGISAVLALFFSFSVILQFLIPQILSGGDLLSTTFITGLAICFVSMFLSHGFNKRTTIAVISTVLTISLTTIVSIWAVDFVSLDGYGSEDAFNLKGSLLTNSLNLRGLLLAGIVIGSLGILDDVTTAQCVAIEEIKKANNTIKPLALFGAGMRVGKEHVISLVNTLSLAYVGTSLPLLLGIVVFNFSPVWVIINDQRVAEELARSILGSACLLLAIPISTVLAVWGNGGFFVVKPR